MLASLASSPILDRRLMPALATSVNVLAPAPDVVEDHAIHFRSDGLALSPMEYAWLLVQLAEDGRIAADEFAREGVVATLEARMAALLGKEMAVFLPAVRSPTILPCASWHGVATGWSCSAKATSITTRAIVRRS